jgi:glycosyltransferase involved in cell wall biosynthesis
MSIGNTSRSNGPLISVLMPFYNAQQTIEAAVQSILQQTYQNWELLLLDDGSTDKSRSLVESFGDPRLVIWSDGKQKGLAPRLNECVARAGGQFIARMDSDDISYPDRLAAQVGFLESHAGVDLVGCSVVVFGDDGAPLGKRVVPETHDRIVQNPSAGFGLAHPTWLARAAWFKHNHYDPQALRYEDFELLHRTYQNSQFANLPDLLFGYREPRNGFRKRFKTRLGRVRYFYDRRDVHGNRFWNAAKHECWKVVADAAVVVTSQRYAMLKTYTQALTPGESITWQHVLNSANQSRQLA